MSISYYKMEYEVMQSAVNQLRNLGSMSPLQKDAILGIVIAAITAVLFIVLLLSKNSQIAYSAFSILALHALIAYPAFYKKKGKKVLLDERDKEIAGKAVKTGFGLFWLMFCFISMVTWIIRDDGTIPAMSLLYLLFGGWILILTERSVAVLILYGQGKRP